MHRLNRPRPLRRLATSLGLGALLLGAPRLGLADGSLTLWSEESLKVAGSSNVFCGTVHSNGTVDVTGNGNTMSGPLDTSSI